MSGEWTPVSVDFLTDPAMVAAGPDGKLLYLAGLCYAQKHTTDGLIPKAVLPVLLAQAPAKAKAADRLVDLDKWADEGDCWRITQWHRWNDPADVITARRERERQRKAEWRLRKAGPDAGRDASRDAGRDASRPRLPAAAPSPAPSTTPKQQQAEISTEAVEIVMQRRGRYEMAREKQAGAGWLAAARRGIAEELREHPDYGRLVHDNATPDAFADLLEPPPLRVVPNEPDPTRPLGSAS